MGLTSGPAYPGQASLSRKAYKKSAPAACGLARPKKPRGPKTAYNFFYEEERKVILKEDDPDKALPPSRHHKIIGSKWRRVGKGAVLQKYQAMADKDQERYDKEAKEYKKEEEVFKKEEEKAQKKIREEEEKAAKLVRERIASTIQAFGEGGGGSMLPIGAQPMGSGLPGLYGLDTGGQDAGRFIGSSMGPAVGQVGALPPSAWGMQSNLSPAPPVTPTAMSSAAGSVGWAAPGVMTGQVAGQMAGQPAAGAPVAELVQRLRQQRAALEETTDALLEASNQEYATTCTNLAAPSATASAASGSGPAANAAVGGSAPVGVPKGKVASVGHGVQNNTSLATPGATANTNLAPIQPSPFASGPANANAAIIQQSLGQQMGTSGADASRKPTYSELMASSSNPGAAPSR